MQFGDSGLTRSMRKWDLVAVTVNAVIGAGIFGLPSRIYNLAGVYSVPASLLCGVFTAMMVLCFAEVGSRFTETGGPYLYAREAFGPLAGFTIGWLIWIARISAFAGNTSIMLQYLGFLWPAATGGAVRATVVCTVTLVLTTINILGVRSVTVTTNILTAAKLAPLTLLVVAGVFLLDRSHFSFGPAPTPAAFSSAMLLLAYAYTGFEIAVIPAAEIRDPRHDLPAAILTGIGVVVVLYVLIQVVCIGTLSGLAATDRPLADAAGRLLGPSAAAVFSAATVVSIAGNLNVVMLAASRLPFAMAARGELPGVLASVHQRYRTPHVAILVTAALMAALTLSGTFLYAVTISIIARLLIYAATCAALPVLRMRPGAASPAFRIPGGTGLSIATLTMVAWLLSNTTWREGRDVAAAAAIGWVVYGLCRLSSFAG